MWEQVSVFFRMKFFQRYDALQRTLLIAGCWVAGLSVHQPAMAQSLAPQLRLFTTRQGLTDDHVSSIVQDDRGFLWIGTSDGLDRYDGTVFTPFYHTGSPQSLPSNNIVDLQLLPGNQLAMATVNGLCVMNTVTLRCHIFQELKDTAFYSFNNYFIFIKQDRNHHLWAASRTSLYLFDDTLGLLKAWHHPLTPSGVYNYFYQYFTYPDGTPGFMFYNGNSSIPRMIYRFERRDTSLRKDTILNREMGLGEQHQITFMEGNRFGLWWVRQDLDTLYHLGPKNAYHAFLYPFFGKKQQLYSYMSTRDDSVLWSGNSDGYLVAFNMKQHRFMSRYFYFDRAPSVGSWVFADGMLRDNENNLWLTTVDGLYQYSAREKVFQVFDTVSYFKNAPIRSADINAILPTDEGYWVGTYGGGLYWLDPAHHVSRHFDLNSWHRNWVWSIRRYRGDTLWIGTQAGLIWFNEKNHHTGMVHSAGFPRALDTFTVTTQFVDSHQDLWLGISNGRGLVRYNLESGKVNWYLSELPIPLINCITEDENGNLWMGSLTGGGLVCWNRRTDRFSLLPAHPNSSFKNDKMYSIYADKMGSVWFNAGATGLEQYDIKKKKFTNYSRADGLCSDVITCITGSGDHLWISTTNGISRFTIPTRQFKNYSTADGLPANYFNFISSHNGSVLAGGKLSLTIFRDSLGTVNPYPPRVYITDMLVRGKKVLLPVARPLSLKYNQNYVRFDYVGINYLHAPENRYAYKLAGADPDWVQAGHVRNAVYANLSPGTYTFQVKAQNSDGLWSLPVSGITITIRPPFWKTVWFFILALVTAFLLGYIFYRYRLRHVVQLQRIRNHIAADLHDDMGASLSNINILSTMALRKHGAGGSQVKRMLENIRDDAQQMSEAIDDIVWTVNPKNDSLDRILSRMRYYASELFEARDIQYEIRFPARTEHMRIPIEKRREFFLIFKEAVNNLVKHSRCTRALLELSIEGNHIRMDLLDNGQGFDPGLESARGNGLQNMRRRSELIHARLQIASRPGNGTRLTLVM